MNQIKYLLGLEYDKIAISLAPAVGLILLFLLVRKPLVNLLFRLLGKIASKTKTKADDRFLVVLRSPLKMLLTFTIFYIAYKMFDKTLLFNAGTIESLNKLIFQLYRTVILIFFYLLLYNSAGESKALFGELEEFFEIRIDKLLIPFISKVFRLILTIIFIAAVASDWGYDVNGFVAGLGIGGLAFALAAKDTLANAFGGAVLITEKPFTIGDWIVVAGVEGTVEDINFRSTKIRKFNKAVVTVPNSVIVISNIINYSKRDIRRVSYELKIRVETPVDQVKAVVKDIKTMLVDHAGIDNETIFVRFNKFGESSLNIFLYYFTNTSVWSEYLALTEDTNFLILEILKNNDVELAVPMQVIKVENQAG